MDVVVVVVLLSVVVVLPDDVTLCSIDLAAPIISSSLSRPLLLLVPLPPPVLYPELLPSLLLLLLIALLLVLLLVVVIPVLTPQYSIPRCNKSLTIADRLFHGIYPITDQRNHENINFNVQAMFPLAENIHDDDDDDINDEEVINMNERGRYERGRFYGWGPRGPRRNPVAVPRLPQVPHPLPDRRNHENINFNVRGMIPRAENIHEDNDDDIGDEEVNNMNERRRFLGWRRRNNNNNNNNQNRPRHNLNRLEDRLLRHRRNRHAAEQLVQDHLDAQGQQQQQQQQQLQDPVNGTIVNNEDERQLQEVEFQYMNKLLKVLTSNVVSTVVHRQPKRRNIRRIQSYNEEVERNVTVSSGVSAVGMNSTPASTSLNCAHVHDYNGRLPLHFAIERGITLSTGLREIMNANLDALFEPDGNTRVYPFALARHDVNLSYSLLKEFPAVMKSVIKEMQK